MYIKDEKTAYVCTDGDWMVSESDDEGDDDGRKSSSSVIPGSDPESSSDASAGISYTTQNALLAILAPMHLPNS